MASYKEIVTKAVIGKGKKTFTNTQYLTLSPPPTTILGCWIINHTFEGHKVGDQVTIDGSYDINIWYSYDNDTKTEVVRQNNTYQETVNVRKREDSDLITNEEIIVRSLRQPSCTKAEIENGQIVYTVEKELGIELVGDTKVKIAIDEEEEPWDDILDDVREEVEKTIDNEVQEEYLTQEETEHSQE